eukprot:m.313568 g.313568  ORF g.313568 m.313568 type:complete len:58 (+) comp404651_c0_seq1:227-400(+)
MPPNHFLEKKPSKIFRLFLSLEIPYSYLALQLCAADLDVACHALCDQRAAITVAKHT